MVVVILFLITMDLHIASPGLFIITIIFGNFGLSAVLTIIAALISKANSKGSLYPVLSFPLLLPLLMATISSTWLSIDGTTFEQIAGDIQIIVSYTIVTITASFMLFDLVWSD